MSSPGSPGRSRRGRFTSRPTSAHSRADATSALPRSVATARIELVAHPGLTTVDEVEALRTAKNRPYTVFSPFHRAWLEVPRRDTIGAPRKLPALPPRLRCGRLPQLGQLGFEQEVAEPLLGGRSPARERLRRFLVTHAPQYGSHRDALGEDSTSRLSPYLHFGCLSPGEVERRLPPGKGTDAFRRQLCWRDFYHHVLLHYPRNARSEFQQRYRGSIRWSHAGGPSRSGPRDARATPLSTLGCDNSAARAGCTIEPASSSPRS